MEGAPGRRRRRPFWGDIFRMKEANTLRIGFQNIGGFPVKKFKIKEDITREGIC
jgi:hypothetical protein